MKTIVGVPESLTRVQVVHLIESLGFEAQLIRRLEFRLDGVYAEVMNKPTRIDFIDNSVVVHTVFIPVDPDPS